MNVEVLAAPLRLLITALGTGVLPAGGALGALDGAPAALGEAADLTRGAAAEATAGWLGAGGEAAGRRAANTAEADRAGGLDGSALAGIVQTAADRVRRAHTELNGLLDSFLRAAAAPVATPAGIALLIAIAADHLRRGLAIVTRTQSELAGDARALDSHRVADADGCAAGPATSPGGVPAGGGPAVPGRVPVTLPDGSVAYAPNERAAAAVRAALGQRGVPYVWGGTTPDGFDCSGFTQWAYRQAGLELPRLAQDQDTAGFPVAQSQLLPGDLAVWSGHVAMYIGNDQLVEAGDPVQVSPLRTTNLDQQFEGFYRPR